MAEETVSHHAYRPHHQHVASVSCPHFPPKPKEIETPYAEGVTMIEHPGIDEYVGTAEALVLAGLVPEGHFPGMPGMKKTSVSFLDDGSVYERKSTHAIRKTVTKSSGGRWMVRIRLSRDVCKQRLDVARLRTDAWRDQVRELATPPRLSQIAVKSRSHLRLVWSAPA